VRGLKLMQKHKVEYNVLACVARETAARPLEVYRFFRDAGVEFIQFTPIVERMPDPQSAAQGLRLAAPRRWTARKGRGGYGLDGAAGRLRRFFSSPYSRNGSATM